MLAFLWKATKELFFALPGIVAFFVAAAALAVIYMEELQQKLKDRRAIRWIVAAVLLLMGVGAFVSDRVQKSQDINALITAVRETAEKTSTNVSASVSGKVTDVLNKQ